MAITVKHTKVSTVPDTSDTDLVRPSDWNADHTLTGLGTMAEQAANNVAITGGSISGTTVSGYIPTSEKGAALGVATLDAGGKVPTSQIPLQGDLNYQGTWNATTNTPTLTSSTGTQGYYYVVDVAGSTNLNGITDWQVGDWAIFNGSVWQKVDNTDAVTSVNGLVGTVVLTTTNIAEGTNEYFTTARARASISAGTGISYDSGTGVITNSSPSLGGDVVGPASATDNAIARFDSTTGKLIQNSVVTVSDTGAIDGATTITNLDYLDFDTTYATALGAGQLGWNGNDTLGLGMIGGNVVQHIGEDTFFYVKASSAITKGQLCMFTGAVGSSGVLTAAPSNSIPFAEAIIGVAAEDIALNGFGLIQNNGTLRGVDTSAFLDGDILYYNSAVTGGFTKVFPTSGPIVIAAAVAKSGSGGSGVLTVRISFQTRVTASTGISVSQGNDTVTVTNTAPDQTVAISSGTGISVSGTYPNFTVTNTAPSSGGTVTSVSGTAPIASSGGNTPAISISQATTSTDGYLSSTDWNTFNNKGSGTVTSVDLTAGTGISVSGGPVTSSGSITVTNSAPMTYAGAGIAVSTGSAWGTSLTAPSGAIVGTTDTQTLSNKTITNLILDGYIREEVFAVSGTTPALSPSNGTIQTWTLSGNSTPTQGTWTEGESMTLMINDGTAFTVTWSSIPVVWVGGSAPTLATTGFTVIELWEVGTTIYGALVGNVA